MNGVTRELLTTWPGRFRFPGLLVALAEDRARRADPGAAAGDPELDGGVLAAAVLANIEGVPPRAAFDVLLARGEHDAAEYVLDNGLELSEHDAAVLAQKLKSARADSADAVRQRVEELVGRAEAAGVVFDRPDLEVLAARARSSTTGADAALSTVEQELDEEVALLSEELETEIAAQERAAHDSAEASGRRAATGFAVGQMRALLREGELVAVRKLLNREPVGVLVPEAVAPLPAWNADWTPESLLEYHLNPMLRRPPQFAAWDVAGRDGGQLLAAFDRLSREDSREAAEDFATSLGRFLGASTGATVAHRTEGGHFTFFDGMFTGGPLSRLHPTGRVDLYVASPGTSVVPATLAAQAPHVAVGSGLRPTDYADRQSTAVLGLRDLLRLVVVPSDRGAALLGLLAPQWPVEALIGDGPATLARVLGDDTDEAWRTLRWITHLSLRGGASLVRAMENCTGMDHGLLKTMLRHAQDVHTESARKDLWATQTGGWRKDEALVHALRHELVTRCGEPAAQAAWWAALATCDAEGFVTWEDIKEAAEICSTSPDSGAGVVAGGQALVARGLLENVGRDQAPADGARLRIRLNGAAQVLLLVAEQQLATVLGRMERSAAIARGATGDESPVVDRPTHPRWSVWHRNRFRTVPSHGDYVAAEERGAGARELSAIIETAERELREQAPDQLIGRWTPAVTDLGIVLRALASDWKIEYPDIHYDLRCPDSLPVAVPEPVARAVLYEVLDNAAEALAGRSGVVQVSVVPESPEVLVDVRDNGPGLPPEAHGRRLFLAGWSTRGAGRGGGLHRVRQLLRAFSTSEVEADVEVFGSSHPTLTGAALRLMLPEHRV